MNILMFNYEYPPLGGGGGVVHQHIAEELAKRHQVTVVTSGAAELPSRETVRGVDVHRIRVLGRNAQATASLVSMLSYFPASLKAGQRLIDALKPDIINSHFAVPTGPSAVLLARRNRIPHALCIHGGDIYDPSKKLSPHRNILLRRTVRWVLHKSDRVLAQSKNTSENARQIYGYNSPVTIIPHGLRAPSLPSFSRTELGLTADQIVLVTVGRLVARKANHQLIEMVARLNNPKIVLAIVGDGPQRDMLTDLAKRLGVDQQVVFTGFVTEERKFQFLQAADAFVSTTSHEGFGLMYVEAMFCGLPIVTYDHGGQSDFLEDGRTGFLVRLNDQEGFLQSVQRLIETPSARKTIGSYNLRLAERFTIERCAAQYEQVFQDMLSAGDRLAPARRVAQPAGLP